MDIYKKMVERQDNVRSGRVKQKTESQKIYEMIIKKKIRLRFETFKYENMI